MSETLTRRKRAAKPAPNLGWLAGKRVLTTGEVARVMGCSPKSVQDMVDEGILPGYRIPGSDNRRIPREGLVALLRKRGIPCGELDGSGLRLLVVSPDLALAGRVAAACQEIRPSVAWCHADNVFDAGRATGAEPFPLAVLDCGVGRGAALDLCRRLGAAELAVLADDDEADEAELRALAGFVSRKPADPKKIARALLGGR